MVSPEGGTPFPVQGGCLGKRKPGFLETLFSRPSQVPGFAPAFTEPSAPYRVCCMFHLGEAGVTQGSCLSPSFIYFLESFFNTLILVLVLLFNSIFGPCALTHLIG